MTDTAGRTPTGKEISHLPITNQSQHNNFTLLGLTLEADNVMRVCHKLSVGLAHFSINTENCIYDEHEAQKGTFNSC